MISFDIDAAMDYNNQKTLAGQLGPEHIAKLAAAYQSLRENLGADGKIGGFTLADLEKLVAGKIRRGRGTRFNPVVDPDVWSDWVQPMDPLVDSSGELHPWLISSGFSFEGQGEDDDRDDHWGADLMVRRHPLDGGPTVEKKWGHWRGAKKPTAYSPWWYCPHNVPLRVVGPGTVWSVQMGSNNNVLVDHHNVPGFGPLTTWYQHMDEVHVKRGQQLLAGQVIGSVGDGSSNLNHLHFEFRDHTRGGSRQQSVITPSPFLAVFKTFQGAADLA